jgi:hypothetical protein
MLHAMHARVVHAGLNPQNQGAHPQIASVFGQYPMLIARGKRVAIQCGPPREPRHVLLVTLILVRFLAMLIPI